MAVRKAIQAAKEKQNKLKQAPQEVPVAIETKKKQIENDFVPETNPDAQTFSRDLKNLEQLNTKFRTPLEIERQKELAQKKASEEWKKALDDEKREK